jgi:hypothetical protein
VSVGAIVHLTLLEKLRLNLFVTRRKRANQYLQKSEKRSFGGARLISRTLAHPQSAIATSLRCLDAVNQFLLVETGAESRVESSATFFCFRAEILTRHDTSSFRLVAWFSSFMTDDA